MSALPPPPPGLDINESRRPECLASSIVTWTLAIVAVALRFWARRLMKTKFWLDDWFAVASLRIRLLVDLQAPKIVYKSLASKTSITGIAQGYGQHYYVLGPDFVTNFFKNLFTGEILYALVICMAKFSILAFYWRLFSASVRIPCFILGTITVCWTIAVILVTVFQCDPVSGFWNRNKPAKCNVDDYAFFVANAVPNIVTDAALLALPMPYIWRLHRTIPQKIALAGIFALGGFVIIISIVRLATLVQIDLKSPDLDYNFAMVGVWTITEGNMAIVSACLPSHRPILNLVLYGKPNNSAWDSKGYDSSARSWGKGRPSAKSSPSREHAATNYKGVSDQGYVKFPDDADNFSRVEQSHAVVSVGERRDFEDDDIEMQQPGGDRKKSGIYVRSDVNVNWAPTN
ncbi:hypothetical protein ACLMJK_000358 [Lecanora helva]